MSSRPPPIFSLPRRPPHSPSLTLPADRTDASAATRQADSLRRTQGRSGRRKRIRKRRWKRRWKRGLKAEAEAETMPKR
eukprot:6173004-Pleurochrysis_carterae.AAC.3